MRLRLARKRLGERTLTAPIDGVVIPSFGSGPASSEPSSSSPVSPDASNTAAGAGQAWGATGGRSPGVARTRAAGVSSLRDRVGQVATEKSAWCRIAEGTRLVAVIQIDARDRGRIEVGTPVTIRLGHAPGEVITSRVTSVSAVAADATSVTRRAAYRVLCELPSTSATLEPAPRRPVASGAGKTPTGESRTGEFVSQIGGSCDAVFRFPPRPLVTDIRERIGEWLRT